MTHTDLGKTLRVRKQNVRPLVPSYRHAAPSGPWPWMDLWTPILPEQLKPKRRPVSPLCDHTDCGGECWMNYPASLFPNWMQDQVRRAKIANAIELYDEHKACVLYVVDTDTHGRFHSPDQVTVKDADKDEFWNVWLRSKVRYTPVLRTSKSLTCM